MSSEQIAKRICSRRSHAKAQRCGGRGEEEELGVEKSEEGSKTVAGTFGVD